MSEDLEFVNIFGDKVDTTKRIKPAKRESTGPEKYHKGWRVIGVSPEAIAAAKDERERAIQAAKKRNADYERGTNTRLGRAAVPPPFDESEWIKSAPLKPARSKPFEVPEAAQLCFDMAKKAGWHRVEMRVLAKGEA
ncbi:hypothetical protein [Variovorax sp. DAIF25]|uniref:hypothetical protein n=1 Tax=Variovorax sp. DAIF25 TaxID=3080983 RepID=UPI003D6C3E3F